jgi:RND family efflux transporter MFP subunit
VVGEKSSADGMILVGEVRPRYESSQGFRVNGKIIKRNVEVGALIKKGQVLAYLDPLDNHLSVTAALAAVSAAEADKNLALAELNRQRQLFAKKFISASALDIKEAQYTTASARLAQVKAQAQVTENQMQYVNLSSDRDGVITMIHAEPGQVIETGDVIVKIADTQATDVSIAVPESRMSEVKLNAQVIVRLWVNKAKTYTGVVREISPIADEATHAFNVRITINQADAAIKLGMTAAVHFNVDDSLATSGYLIPSRAVTEINNKSIVWVIDEHNKAQPREVSTGPYTEDGVLIKEGLQAGEKIAIAGVHTLIKDQLVKPIVETAP